MKRLLYGSYSGYHTAQHRQDIDRKQLEGVNDDQRKYNEKHPFALFEAAMSVLDELAPLLIRPFGGKHLGSNAATRKAAVVYNVGEDEAGGDDRINDQRSYLVDLYKKEIGCEEKHRVQNEQKRGFDLFVHARRTAPSGRMRRTIHLPSPNTPSIRALKPSTSSIGTYA